MAHERAVKNISALFLALPLIGAAQFIAANAVSIRASVLFGGVALVCWGAGLGWVAATKGIFSGLPRRGLAVLIPFAIWMLWLSSMPPYFRDDLIIHLAYPKYLLHAGKWVFIPFQHGTANPNMLVPLNMVFVAVGMDWAASFIPAFFSMATALLLAHWVAMERGGVWGLFSAAALLTVPIFFRLSTTAYNDPAVMFFSCAGAFYFCRLVAGDGVMPGVFGAVLFATGSAIKYNAGLLLVMMLAALFFMGRRVTVRDKVRVLVVATLAVLLSCGPWWLKHAQAGPPPPVAGPAFNGPIQERMALCGDSALWALTSPVRIFFEGREGSSCTFDGRLNPLFLVLGLIAPFLVARFAGYPFLAVPVFLYMLFSALSFSITARYFLPILPSMVFLSAAFLAEIAKRGYLRTAMAVAAAVLTLNMWWYVDSARGFAGWDYLLCKESKEDFLSRSVASYRATSFANAHLKKSDTIYFAFTGNQVYYADTNYYYDSFWDGTTLMRLFKMSHDGEKICTELAGMGFTHMVYRRDIMERFVTANRLQPVFADFSQRCSRTLYEDNATTLVALGS